MQVSMAIPLLVKQVPVSGLWKKPARTARIPFVDSFCGIVNPSESDLMVYVGLNVPNLHRNLPAVVFSQFCKDSYTNLGIQPINN